LQIPPGPPLHHYYYAWINEFDGFKNSSRPNNSFVLGLFVATIFFASRAVEVAIDMDDRITGEKEISRWKWLTLSPRFE